MTTMASFVSGLSLGWGALLVFRGISSGDIQIQGLGGVIVALSAIAWAIIGLKV